MGIILNRRRVIGGGIKYPSDAIMTIESNPEVLAICYSQGWCANQDYMTDSEAAAVRSLGTVFRSKTSIRHFDELQYFTGITSLEAYAFQDCSNLVSVKLPTSLTSMGSNAFRRCSSLVSITISSNVTIDDYAFRDCTRLSIIKSLARTAPSITFRTFFRIKTGGTLYVPSGATGYDVWMGTGNYYLGLYGWTKIEQ